MQTKKMIAGLLLANFFFAIIQTEVSSLYLMISAEFGTGTDYLGLMLSFFILGYFIALLIGSLLYSRVSTRLILLFALFISGLSVIFSYISSTTAVLLTLRLVSGFGYGLFFPAAIVYSLLEESRTVGMRIGLINTAFTLGAAAGIGLWSLLGVLIGWRLSYTLSGFLLFLALPFLLSCKISIVSEPMSFAMFKQVVSSFKTFAVFLNAVLGAATTLLVDNFSVYYLESMLSVPAETAGLVGTVAFLTTIFSAPLAGKFYDKGVSYKTLLVSSGLTIFIGTALMAGHSIFFSVISASLVGVGTGIASTTIFVAAAGKNQNKTESALRVSIVDAGISIGLLISPLYFPLLVQAFGFDLAWVAGSLVLVPAFLLVLALRE